MKLPKVREFAGFIARYLNFLIVDIVSKSDKSDLEHSDKRIQEMRENMEECLKELSVQLDADAIINEQLNQLFNNNQRQNTPTISRNEQDHENEENEPLKRKRLASKLSNKTKGAVPKLSKVSNGRGIGKDSTTDDIKNYSEPSENSGHHNNPNRIEAKKELNEMDDFE